MVPAAELRAGEAVRGGVRDLPGPVEGILWRINRSQPQIPRINARQHPDRGGRLLPGPDAVGPVTASYADPCCWQWPRI
jgi:hypothetical protein